MTIQPTYASRKFMMAGKVAILVVLGGALAGCNQAAEIPPVATDVMNMPVQADAPSAPAPAVHTVGSIFVHKHIWPNGQYLLRTSTVVEEMERDGRLLHRTEFWPSAIDPGGPCDGANGDLLDARSRNWIACLKDGEVLAETTPHNGMLSWPLQVGMAWRWMSRWTDYWLRPDFSGGQWSDHEVTAWEEVEVPAGTFMAYRAELVGTKHRSHTETVWFAPEIGQVIKRTG